jgi:hypothetical protein
LFQGFFSATLLFMVLFQLLVFLLPAAFAGRPVFHDMDRPRLISSSGMIFSAEPAAKEPYQACAHGFGNWLVKKVLKGDKSFEGKVVALAHHGYQYHIGGKAPSYQANRYQGGELGKSPAIVFANRNGDGCFELTADGAHEPASKEREIAAAVGGGSACDANLEKFEKYVATLAKNCETHADCERFYVHPNSCAKPYALNKSAKAKIAAAEFAALQKAARDACMERWSSQPACSPDFFPVRCIEKSCLRPQ